MTNAYCDFDILDIYIEQMMEHKEQANPPPQDVKDA